MTAIPSTWAEVALSDLGTWYGGTTPQKSNPAYWLNGQIPWVSPKDMKVDFIIDTEDKLTQRAIDEGRAQTLPRGTLLIVTRSGILQHTVPVAVTEVEVAINQDIKALVPALGIASEFVAAQLRWRTPELLAHAAKAGTTVDSLDFERLKSFKVRVAPPLEQLRIADRLRTLRAGIARVRLELDQVRTLATRARETVADLASTGQLTLEWREEVDAPAPVEVDVRDLVTAPIRTGLSIRGRSEPPGVRALRLSALRGTIVDLADVRYLPLDPSQVERFELRENDVLISRGSGTKTLVGRASLVPRIDETTIFPDTAFRLRLDPTRILPEWFVAVWNSPSTRAKFEKRVRTTAGIWKIALRDLSTIALEVPPLDEQRAAVDIIQSAAARIDRALAKQERSRRLLDRFEQTLYLMAFEGRLVDRVPDDEDVVTLLANINARPAQKRTRKPKGSPMPTNQERFRDLASTWPKDGHSFEQLRELLPAPYEELKDIVFDAIQRGSLYQQFDEERRTMILMRAQ